MLLLCPSFACFCWNSLHWVIHVKDTSHIFHGQENLGKPAQFPSNPSRAVRNWEAFFAPQSPDKHGSHISSGLLMGFLARFEVPKIPLFAIIVSIFVPSWLETLGCTPCLEKHVWLDGEMVGSGSCIPQRKGDWSPDHTSYPRNDCLDLQVVIGWKWTREMSKEQWGIPVARNWGYLRHKWDNYLLVSYLMFVTNKAYIPWPAVQPGPQVLDTWDPPISPVSWKKPSDEQRLMPPLSSDPPGVRAGPTPRLRCFHRFRAATWLTARAILAGDLFWFCCWGLDSLYVLIHVCFNLWRGLLNI